MKLISLSDGRGKYCVFNSLERYFAGCFHRLFSIVGIILFVFLGGVSIVGCGNEITDEYIPVKSVIVSKNNSKNDLYTTIEDSISLRILAIGNSFTNNSTAFMPWFVNRINSDSVLMAKLVRDGSSLAMHWTSHAQNSPDYDMYVSHDDEWVLTDIHTIDEALTCSDWDIIVIQQVSGLAGDYSTYQPALDYLVRLFKECHPNVMIAWHYTWAYKDGTNHPDFKRYNNDPLTMYEAILAAGDIASADMDFKIPSTKLIWRMRQEFPEIEDGFSSDGFHINNGFAAYALSSLWYECLVNPILGTTSIRPALYPKGVEPAMVARADTIIESIIESCSTKGVQMLSE